MTTDTPIHLGIVGLGDWSKQIFQAVDQLPEVKITQCHSRYPDTMKAFASEYDCAACERYEDMLEDAGIDGVIVMSSNVAHEKDVTLAAARGKHVFVTKPIATTIPAAKRMIDACEKNGVILAVGHQTRREPALRELKKVLDSGQLGDIKLVEANYSTPNGFKARDGNWRWAEDECPGGVLILVGIHTIDTLHYLLGPIGRVFSWHDSGGLEVANSWVTATLLEFDSGMRGYLGSTYVSGFSHWIKVYGTRKNAYFSELGGLTLTEDSWEAGQVHEVVAPPANVTAPMPAVIEEIGEFARCIRTGQSPEIGGEMALQNLAVVLAAVESARLDKPIEIASLLNKE